MPNSGCDHRAPRVEGFSPPFLKRIITLEFAIRNRAIPNSGGLSAALPLRGDFAFGIAPKKMEHRVLPAMNTVFRLQIGLLV
jgi:hypothetical protein